MSIRKRIAILAGEIEEEYPAQFISGFLTKAFARDYDVCVFAMYRRFQESREREIGESSIFSLVDYDQFDALVLMLDTIQTPGVAKQIEENVRKNFSGPVLVVDIESEYFPYIEMEYKYTTKKLISHLIEHHGYTDIGYVTGWYGHKHAMQRLNAFRECMKEHGLPVKEEWIYYGDFWYNGGEQLITKLMTEGKKLPRAIACANDYMAIGAAKMATKYGFRVPEDIAIVGYDLVEAGTSSPKPITSAPLPTKRYGEHALECIEALFEGREFPEFVDDVDLFIGSSCGCHNESVVPKVQLRERWDTEMSVRAFYAPNNHMNEDLLCQTTLYDLMKTVDYYIFQIRDFDSFHLCLNEDWNDFDRENSRGRRGESFSPTMFEVLKSGAEEDNPSDIRFDTYFDKKVILPELNEEHDKPRVYFFTPLHFEEKCFGYAAVCFENKIKCYNAVYRMWLRNVMQALECFRRIEAVQQSNKRLEASMIRDVLTGLYNYNGFLKQSEQLMRRILREKAKVGVLALDIKELMKINDLYGRSEGDRTILMVARALKETFPDGLSVCFGNGEMVTILLSKGDVEDELQQGYESMKETFAKDKILSNRNYEIDMYYGIEAGNPNNSEDLERLVNIAVSKKNGNKVNERKAILGEIFTEEELEEAKIVEELLDNNRFNYHFQPIVSAKTGEIFGYEALMRPDVTPYMAPPVVLKYTEYFGRLYDVERLTFFNVLDIVQQNKDIFNGNRRIFVNSLPGHLLQGEDAAKLSDIAQELQGTVIVELTEQQELTDDELSTLQDYYNTIGFQTAVDDYGVGYSNVTNLLRYMPKFVKIDRMLLSDIQDSPQKQHFVKDIITFAHDNNIVALAEGIETTEEMKMVIHLGIDLIQGYYTARPAAEIIDSISQSVKDEIIEYNETMTHNKSRQIYVTGKERQISMARLANEKYSIIEVANDENNSKDLAITGAYDLDTDIYLRIKSGYRGRIILNNATFQGKNHGASIDIGKDCDVTLVINGDTHLINGGIRVPEDSKLTLEGDGRLLIKVDGANYFGIGNDINARHGELTFEQDGTIEIDGNGMKGVAIGSGFGGPVLIRKGKYNINIHGQDGVGIGSYSGDVEPIISMADLQINVATSRAVGIGSIMGNVHAHIKYTGYVGEFNAKEAIGIGTFEGKKSIVDMLHSSTRLKLRGQKLCGIGANGGEVLIYLEEGTVHVDGEGTDAIAWGNQQRDAKVKICCGKFESKMKTAYNSNVGAKDEDVTLMKAEYHYMRKGEKVVLEAE